MPITTLDPKTALVVVDLQSGVLALTGAPYSMDDVLARNVELVTAFRAAGLPVVLVNVDGAPGGRTDQNPAGGARTMPAEAIVIAPALGPEATDIVVTKRTRGAFHSTDISDQLAAQGVTQVVVTGVATGSGVMVTAQEAYQHGLSVLLPEDASTDSDGEIHTFMFDKIFPKIGETGSTADVLALLAAR